MSNDTVNEYCKQFKSGQHLGNATGTPWSDLVRGSWKGPRSTVILIEVLASLAAVACMFLATFGSHHCHRGNKFVQKVLLGAYTLSVSLLTYILGSMQSSSVKSSMYPCWAISLVVMYGCTDSITGYVLDTNRQGVEFLYQIVLCYAYMLVILITTWLSDGFHVATLPALFLCVTAVQKYWLRRLACRLASRSSNMDVMVFDYMRGTHLEADGMEGCYYLVELPLSKSRIDAQTCARQLTSDPDKDEIIDVGKVWRSIALEPTPELKEACLSFSLFHLLRRRFFRFECGESKDKSHDFVFRMLLSEYRVRDDCNWVFKVIEIEQAFMYDFFFTKYASLYYGLRAATYWSLASAVCISLTTYAAATRAFTVRCDQAESFVMNTKTDVVVSLLLLTCAGLVELLQPVLYWTTIWGRVSFVCQYIKYISKISKERVSIRKISCLSCPVMMRLKWSLLKIGMCCMSNKHYWQHKLGQYSFLDSVNYDIDPKPFNQWKKIMSSLKIMLGTPDRLIGQTNHRLKVTRKPDKPVELPAEVKKALVGSLLRTWGVLSNGKSSLQLNGAQHLSWACEMDVRSKTISIMLTWHIATCYVEMAATASPCQDVGMCSRDVATKLSKYCAYLLISVPNLLPGQETDSKLLFDAAAGEANAVFQGRTDKYEAMKSIFTSELPNTVFERSIRLGKQLEEMPEGLRWKLLADFWAEMLLYVAPSDNVKAHIEQLAQGGEFITHLWALLFHAGILEREENHPDEYM